MPLPVRCSNRNRRPWGAALAAAGLTLAACGGPTGTDPGAASGAATPAAPTTTAVVQPGQAAATTTAPAGRSAEPAAAANLSILPAIDVVNVQTSETVNLSSLTPAERPILLWFWAPH